MELENRIKHLERMDTLGQISGGVARDFNNQLQTINVSIAMAINIGYSDHWKDSTGFGTTMRILTSRY